MCVQIGTIVEVCVCVSFFKCSTPFMAILHESKISTGSGRRDNDLQICFQAAFMSMETSKPYAHKPHPPQLCFFLSPSSFKKPYPRRQSGPLWRGSRTAWNGARPSVERRGPFIFHLILKIRRSLFPVLFCTPTMPARSATSFPDGNE